MKLSNEVLKLPNVFCVNELEAEEMTGIVIKEMSDVKKAIADLKTKGGQTIIITLGKLGAAFNDDSSGAVIHIPVTAAKLPVVVDTTGAGDAFISALAFFIAKFPNASLVQKIGASIEVASHSVQFKGTQTSFIDFPTIDPMTKKYDFTEL